MTNKIGMIEYRRRKEQHDEKMILITARCPHCQKMAIRAIDCPVHLQDAPPGYIVYVDDQGTLQAMEEP
jgi:hypothetical protein